jgi:flagellar protein FliS
MNESNAYLRTKVMTASPAELRLMLLDGAIKFALQAREGLEAKDYEKSFNGFTSCRNIILELVNGIRPEHDPELAETVRSLYMFIYSELVQASFDKDIPRLAKAIELIEYERETWTKLMDKLASEEARHPAIQPPAATGTHAPGQPAPARSSLSIQA